MRHLLVDHARAAHARKRLTYPDLLPLEEAHETVVTTNWDVLALHEALAQLAELDLRASRVVELRFFFGLTEKEIAQVLEVSLITVKRDWEAARLWLYRRLQPSPQDESAQT